MPPRRILGIGIDTERRDALARFDRAAQTRFGARWLSRDERVWCARQSEPARAMVLCVSGKEAVWKALGGSVGLERITVVGRGGLRRRIRVANTRVRLEWSVGERDVVVTAIATVP